MYRKYTVNRFLFAVFKFRDSYTSPDLLVVDIRKTPVSTPDLCTICM